MTDTDMQALEEALDDFGKAWFALGAVEQSRRRGKNIETNASELSKRRRQRIRDLFKQRIPIAVVEHAIVEGVTCALGGVDVPETLPQRTYGVQAALNYLEEQGYKVSE